MAGREMGAWRAAVPGAARVADEAHGRRGSCGFVDENIQPVLERDGRANLVYRDFKRVGVSQAARWQTMGGRWAKRESKRFRNE